MINTKKYNNTLKYPAYSKIKSNFGYFLIKIVKDSELKDLEKEDCLENICSINVPTDKELENRCNNYFYKNKLKGSVCKNVNSNNPFVRIHTKDSFISWISEIVGLKPEHTKSKLTHIIYAGDAKIKFLLLDSFLNSVAVNDSYATKENCQKYFGMPKWKSKFPAKLRDAHIGNYNFIQWSFPNPTTENIFADQASIENLGCRAGLMDSNKKIIFLHDMDKSFNVRKPTMFDAGFYEQFEPGGKTQPLRKCAHLTGLEEYVHIPNNFANIKNNFYEIFNP
ncbi:MAG: hypothetical protein IPH61_04625 [Bacteroidetes bacterium]|nr:hypothetical protein [Bacteroidota bacterium]